MNVEAAVKSYNPDGLLLARFWHDWLSTYRAARGVLPVEKDAALDSQEKKKNSSWGNRRRSEVQGEACVPVEVVYAVYLRRGVHGERHPVQAAVTDHAGEAARVVGFPHGPQDPVQDGLGAFRAALQSALKTKEGRGRFRSKKPKM